MAEVAVHLSVAMLSDQFIMVTIFIPEDTPIKVVQQKDLPANWNAFPGARTESSPGSSFRSWHFW